MTEPTPPQEPIDAEIVPAEEIAPVAAPRPDYDEHGVPSFDYVRDRIEGRHAASQGATELADATPEGRSVEEQFTERERAAKAKLDEIRRSLG
ncbi:hypothetical protein [Pseudonocardia abyssalis]|uniref:PspA domain-containing protein n=1 Tax=Pseudonocardia abyssalis TaxID=2792008 RepID=A0ABS6UUE3_9PSEU|nr:hypothetical protein [Pseudonocardia abyssalis]MBW0114358.1 PspA domain-containing protein [Pseudonocardia abyssalis]MBW0135374.1 PspA domain-containing protein [Pseudonocardia abyssalis]